MQNNKIFLPIGIDRSPAVPTLPRTVAATAAAAAQHTILKKALIFSQFRLSDDADIYYDHEATFLRCKADDKVAACFEEKPKKDDTHVAI